MSQFVFKKDEDVAVSAGMGGSLDTGVHTIKITGAFLGTTEGGNNTLDLELEGINGGKASIFGMCIDEKWNSGGINYDYPRWQELAAVAGMQTGTTTVVERTAFDGTKTQEPQFDELIGKTLQVAIQVEIDAYNGKEKKRRKISRTFFEDGKSLAEKQSGSEAKQSIQLSKSMKDYETKAYKEFKANGTAGENTGTAEQESVPQEDLL